MDILLGIQTPPSRAILYEAADEFLSALPGVEKSFHISQITYKAGVGFAYLWLPRRAADAKNGGLYLSFCLAYPLSDPGVEQAVEPYPGRFMHHKLCYREDDFSPQVRAWCVEACEYARFRSRKHKNRQK